MDPLRSIAERYWVVYYLVYVAGVAFGASRYHPLREQGKDELFALAAIFALAAGLALLAAIILEVVGRMVLLIPAAIRKIREQERKRMAEALAKAGIRSGESSEVLSPAEIRRIAEDGQYDRS